MSVKLLLYIGAGVCFFLGAIGIGGRVGLVPLGLLLWLIADKFV